MATIEQAGEQMLSILDKHKKSASAAGSRKKYKDKIKPTVRPRGRPAGSKCRINTSVKDAFAQAFERLGGVKGLTDWARRSDANMTEFYKLASKLIPQHVTPDASVTIEILLERLSSSERVEQDVIDV